MSDHHMFLALNGSRQGGIKGESVVQGHEKAIDIQGWSWGMVQEVNALSHSGSKASARAINFQKRIDTASTAIMSAMKSAEEIGEATLTCVDAGGPRPIEYLKIKLKKARICAYDIHSNADGVREVQETFSLAFKEIEVQYSGHLSANAAGGACTFVDQYQ
jgi:type VI secretion system secreted protein Hcp